MAATDAPVLLLGETGTGKELLAQTIYELSNVIERAMILASGDTLHVELPSGTQNAAPGPLNLKENERELILCVLQDTVWRIRGTGGAAQLLGVKPTTLEWRIGQVGNQAAEEELQYPVEYPVLWESPSLCSRSLLSCVSLCLSRC